MAKFERISAETAPPPPAATRPSALQARMREFEAYTVEVGQGEVGVLEPEHTETVRSLAMRIARAGKRTGRLVESWSQDGKLYFSVVDGAAPAKSGGRLELGKKPAAKR